MTHEETKGFTCRLLEMTTRGLSRCRVEATSYFLHSRGPSLMLIKKKLRREDNVSDLGFETALGKSVGDRALRPGRGEALSRK